MLARKGNSTIDKISQKTTNNYLDIKKEGNHGDLVFPDFKNNIIKLK